MAHVVPGLPASPTLTNPDMILPYEDNSARSPTQTSRWQGSDLDTFAIGPPFAQIATPLTPTTPIIYGNGTMLSDIGEVTEAESTPGRRTRPDGIREAVRAREMTFHSSPTTGYSAALAMKRARAGTHERRISVESTDTITSRGQTTRLFDDLDDSLSVDDSNFQGDDEESVFEAGSQYANGADKVHIRVRKASKTAEDDESNSSAALSRRAESILANAKKRLDLMEGNLTRARGSLYAAPSSGTSSRNSISPVSRSTPSPTSRVVTQLAATPARHLALGSPASSPGTPGTPGHSSFPSENNLPSSLSTKRYFIRSSSVTPEAPSKAATRYPIRSSSAAAVYRDTTRGLMSDASQPGITHSSVLYSSRNATPLGPLSEDDTVTNPNNPQGSVAEAHFSTVEHRLTRSASSMQMRDLRDQMKDLRGKISSLRDRAREENMRRRSMQSLRTPSPFTAAEQWYTHGTPYYEKIHSSPEVLTSTWSSNANPSPGVRRAERDNPERPLKLDDAPSIYEDVEEYPNRKGTDSRVAPNLAVKNIGQVTSDAYDPIMEHEIDIDGAEDVNAEDASDYGDEVVNYEELVGYRSESEASVYHESLEAPVSHEDREDAFDYQNYFLHSAMGTFSRQRERRDSIETYNSDDSEGSVETTRGNRGSQALLSRPNDGSSGRASYHQRQASADSISTMATFATANEDSIEADVDDEPAAFAEEEYSPRTVRRSSTPSTVRRESFSDDVSDVTQRPRTPARAAAAPIAPASASPLRSFALEPQERITSPSSAFSVTESSPRTTFNYSQHKASISSFSSSSVGTVRSFPLLKQKTQTPTPPPAQTPSPIRGSLKPSHIIKENTSSGSRSSQLDEPLSPKSSFGAKSDEYGGLGSNADNGWRTGSRYESPVNMLAKEDQVLVESVVASLGKCVLGMQEVNRGTTEGRLWRRRLDTARRVLEGSAPEM